MKTPHLTTKSRLKRRARIITDSVYILSSIERSFSKHRADLQHGMSNDDFAINTKNEMSIFLPL